MNSIKDIAKERLYLFLEAAGVLCFGYFLITIYAPQYAEIPKQLFKMLFDLGIEGYTTLIYVTASTPYQFSQILLILGLVYVAACVFYALREKYLKY